MIKGSDIGPDSAPPGKGKDVKDTNFFALGSGPPKSTIAQPGSYSKKNAPVPKKPGLGNRGS